MTREQLGVLLDAREKLCNACSAVECETCYVPRLIEKHKRQVAKTADAVEMVRCKNCIYAERCGEKMECMHDHGLVEMCNENDFCSYGIAKE